MTNWKSLRDCGLTDFCDTPLDCRCTEHPVKVAIRGLPDGTTYNRSYCDCCGRVYGHKVVS